MSKFLQIGAIQQTLMRSDICIGQNYFGAIFTQVIYNLFFEKYMHKYTQISMSPLNFVTLGRFSCFRFEDFLEIRLYESKLYESKLYESKLYESKLYESKLYELKLYELELYGSKLYEMLLSPFRVRELANVNDTFFFNCLYFFLLRVVFNLPYMVL